MVTRGTENSRLKDFYDVHLLSSRFAFAGDRIVAAITATFARRKASLLASWPVALTHDFYEDTARTEQWQRFLERTKLADEGRASFVMIGDRMRAFLEPPLRATKLGQPYAAAWPAGGPWQ